MVTIILFVILFIALVILKLIQKSNPNSAKLKKIGEIAELALIVQFLIVLNDILSIVL